MSQPQASQPVVVSVPITQPVVTVSAPKLVHLPRTVSRTVTGRRESSINDSAYVSIIFLASIAIPVVLCFAPIPYNRLTHAIGRCAAYFWKALREFSL